MEAAEGEARTGRYTRDVAAWDPWETNKFKLNTLVIRPGLTQRRDYSVCVVECVCLCVCVCVCEAALRQILQGAEEEGALNRSI